MSNKRNGIFTLALTRACALTLAVVLALVLSSSKIHAVASTSSAVYGKYAQILQNMKNLKSAACADLDGDGIEEMVVFSEIDETTMVSEFFKGSSIIGRTEYWQLGSGAGGNHKFAIISNSKNKAYLVSSQKNGGQGSYVTTTVYSDIVKNKVTDQYTYEIFDNSGMSDEERGSAKIMDYAYKKGKKSITKKEFDAFVKQYSKRKELLTVGFDPVVDFTQKGKAILDKAGLKTGSTSNAAVIKLIENAKLDISIKYNQLNRKYTYTDCKKYDSMGGADTYLYAGKYLLYAEIGTNKLISMTFTKDAKVYGITNGKSKLAEVEKILGKAYTKSTDLSDDEFAPRGTAYCISYKFKETFFYVYFDKSNKVLQMWIKVN